MDQRLRALLTAAIRAPSGDNTQPWRFVVDESQSRIVLYLDDARDSSPMNAGQRMARIAVGASLENMLYSAASNGWEVELEDPAGRALAALRLHGTDERPASLPAAVVERVTNRRCYDRRPLPKGLVKDLARNTLPTEGVATHWICDRDRIAAYARLISRADTLSFSERTIRRAFLSKVRFDAPARAEVEDGLSLACLELSTLERLGLRLMPRLPNSLVHLSGALRALGAHTKKLVESASGLCLVTAPDPRPETDLLVGRAVERAWLALTARGLAAQPVMSLPVLENISENGAAEVRERVRRTGGTELLQELRDLTEELGGDRPGFLMRFGYAPAPTGRTGRLPIAAVVEFEAEGTTVGGKALA
jgi:nitroreductase